MRTVHMRWFASLGGAVLLAAFAGSQPVVVAKEFQWAVDVAPAQGRNEAPKAFLWVPPHVKQVRGVVVGQHNMEEQGILESPIFRQRLTELGFAAIWVAPYFDPYFRFDQDAGERFEKMMGELADVSGYGELRYAPVVGIGHSACASYPWYIAMWKPERVLAGVSTSGQWPYVVDEKNGPAMSVLAGRNMDTVPALVTIGEYEWVDERMPAGLKLRAEHPGLPLTAVGCPADGHFAALDGKIELIGLWIKKAAEARLPAQWDGQSYPPLRKIDVMRDGWHYDRYRQGKPPIGAAGAVTNRSASEAFWAFDQEMARAIEGFQAKYRQGKPFLLGYKQNGEIVPQKNNTHQQVTLSFRPEADGVTFKLEPVFLSIVPEGRPARWVGQEKDTPIADPGTPEKISIKLICGPVRQLDDQTWQVALNRQSYLKDRRGNEAWFVAVHPGEGADGNEWKRAVQQAQMRIPLEIKNGEPQTITFPEPSPIRVGGTGGETVKLTASADSGMLVRYFIRSGPAEVIDDQLVVGVIPDRAKWPVRVEVVAWQFGLEGKWCTAEPVTRVIELNR